MKKLLVIAAIALGLAISTVATIVVPAAAAFAALDDSN